MVSVWVWKAIAVGRDVFRPSAAEFIELLMRIQSAFVCSWSCACGMAS